MLIRFVFHFFFGPDYIAFLKDYIFRAYIECDVVAFFEEEYAILFFNLLLFCVFSILCESVHCLCDPEEYISASDLNKNTKIYIFFTYESWCWRRMEKIKWQEKWTNEVLECIGEKRTLLNNILFREANWIGHILRRNCLIHDTIEAQMTEVKGVGRRTQLIDDSRNRRRYLELKEEAEDRKRGKRQFINQTLVSSISHCTC